MAEDKDFNDVLEDIFLSEETEHKLSYAEGFKAGSEAGNPEGYHLGYHRGAELGRELGYYLGVVTYFIQNNEHSDAKYTDKVTSQLAKVKELIDAFPRINSEEHDILGMAENIRAQYKKMLKIMDSTFHKISHHLDGIIRYLNPLLPLANCHMVEFFTQNHWEKLVPTQLRKFLDGWELNYAVQRFYDATEGVKTSDNSELYDWITAARSHCVTINGDYCLSAHQFQERIKSLGGDILPEIKIKEFMNNKKSYEVQTMSQLVASLHTTFNTTCCIEAGGGRGHLPAALSLGYGIPSLTVDCDEITIKSAIERVKIIQKQWHAIAKRIRNGNEEQISFNKSLDSIHRFANSYITAKTNLAALVREKFPEYAADDVKLLLTGLHTCGNLGPDSLRIFTSQSSIRVLFNVPCCYHLLTEELDESLFDVFQKNYGAEQDVRQGFPMSEYMKGYNLGRNARMLAAQSIDRVLKSRQLPSKSLLYRALLQVIIKKHKPDLVLSEGKMKRVTPKCQDFKQYFKMADAILNLDLFDSFSDSYLTEVCIDVDRQWKELVMFYLLRLCLAQVIESVILLDRLLFLMENGFKNVYLVRLFDPVLSPRCHSIVALR